MNQAIGLLVARSLPVTIVMFLIVFLTLKYAFKRPLPALTATFMFIAIWGIATFFQIARTTPESIGRRESSQGGEVLQKRPKLSMVPRPLTSEELANLTVRSAFVSHGFLEARVSNANELINVDYIDIKLAERRLSIPTLLLAGETGTVSWEVGPSFPEDAALELRGARGTPSMAAIDAYYKQ